MGSDGTEIEIIGHDAKTGTARSVSGERHAISVRIRGARSGGRPRCRMFYGDHDDEILCDPDLETA